MLFRVTALHQVAADERGIRLQARCIGGSAEEIRLGDEKRLIALAKEGRQQLEAQWAQERAQRRERGDWQAPVGEEPPGRG